MENYAIHKNAMIAPRKARMTLDLIRGKSVSAAQGILANTNTKASRLISKVLDSAIANAVNNNKMDEKKLYVSEARVDMAPTMKRIMFDSRGHVGRKDKRCSHIKVAVMEK